MRLLRSFIMFILLLYPTYSFAEAEAVPQENQNNTDRNSRRAKPSDNADRPHKPSSDSSARPSNNNRPSTSVNRPNHRPSNVSRPSVKPSNNHRPNTQHVNRPSNHYNYNYVSTTRNHSRVYYVSRRAYTPRYSTVIVYDRPNMVEYVAANEDTTVKAATAYNKTFGVGFIGVVEVNSPIGNLDSHSSGGFGFYIKYRPVRYFSIEFTNDYLFGTLKYTDNYMLGYAKTLLALGTRIHFLDYGIVDTYAVLAASLSIISYPDDYNYKYDTYISGQEYQYGGQFGIGFGYITCIFEIGFDVRYTIESVPDYIPYYVSNEDDKIIHGGLFTLSIGLAL